MVKRTRRHWLQPNRAEPPPGYMFFYRRLMRITDVERYAKLRMNGFDQLPRCERDKLNYEGEYEDE